MKIDNRPNLDFKNVLIKPQRTTITSRSEVNLCRKFTFPNSQSEWEGVPIMAANMDTTGTFSVCKVLATYKILTCLHKFYTLNDYQMFFCQEKNKDNDIENIKNYMVVSTGIGEKDFINLCSIMDNISGLKWICIDVANGYMQKMISFCKKVRERYPKLIIIAGNVATSEMTQEYIINGGVDVVKVGIGPGSACLTRLKTGVGVPQLSAIIDCADAAHGCGGFIIGDGGITSPGDMAKAFGGGADFVMCGGIFSGHDENPGEVVEKLTQNGETKKFKYFYGMSSEHAMKKHYGQMAKYRSSEGRFIKVPYRGSLGDTVEDYLGGLRSTCAYVNAYKIKHLPKCTTFLLVTQQLNTHLVE
mgnify:CR=1 FL=1